MSKKEEIQKFKDKILETTNNPNIIEGIHNYCDRWCEKCMHTKHCAVFLLEQKDENSSVNDISNKEFWDKLSLIFEATFEMISESAEKFGIDLNDIKDETYKVEINKTETEKSATEYGMKISDWLEQNHDLFIRKAKTLNLINPEKLISLTDAVEIIRWYSLFISVKIHRANFSEKLDNDTEFERDDRNGSAKIALIAIDRSIEALTFLYKHIKEKQDEILDFMVQLSIIRRQTEAKFPNARQFKRPGFDD